MNEKSIAKIACRVLSIYTIIKGIERISYLLSISLAPFLSQGFDKNTIIQMIFISILPSIVLIIIGYILWVKATKISNYMLHDNESIGTSKTNINIIDIETTAFSVVGLIILVNLIPDISKLIPKIAFFTGEYIPNKTILKLEVKVSIIELIIRFIVGLLLLLKSRGIVGFIRKLRQAGLKDLDK